MISNLHGFINRHLDTGFRTKWSGYWAPPYKFLDYYGVKINGIWLDPESLNATEYGESIAYHHETDSLEITEKVLTPERLPGFRLELEIQNKMDEKKALHTVIEPGIDIRKIDEDLGPEEYEMDKGKNRLTVSNQNRKLMISGDSFELDGGSYTKEHFPGEKQRCFIPGQLVFRREIEPHSSETIELEFTTSDASFKSLETVEQQLEHPLGRTFQCSIDSMENLVYDRNGVGVIAGHPWFQSYWARDTFWTLLGMIDAGYFELSEQILQNFAERGLPGKINLDGEEEEIEREDTGPLFIIAADKLRRHHGITQEIEEAMEEAMERLELDGNVVNHSEDGTWMDTLEREKAVDIQSLWLEAADIMDDPKKKKLEKGLEKFEENGHLTDQLKDESPETINPAIPLMFNQVDPEIAEEQLEKINGEFCSRFGTRTRSAVDPGYDSGGYHTGSSWGLTTGWAAAANLRNGNTTQGKNFLQKMEQLLDRDQPGALPEVVDSENGELLGCPEQAWSAGMFVHVVDTYLLGIRPKDDHVEIDPVIETSATRTGKRVKGERLDLEFSDGEVEVLNDPDLKLEVKT